MKVAKAVLLSLIFVSLVGLVYTNNQIERLLGGSVVVALPPCERLETATWKRNDLWFLTSEDCSKAPKTHTFKDGSSLGQRVTIIEK